MKMKSDVKSAILVVIAAIGLPLLIVAGLVATDILYLDVDLAFQAIILLSTVPFLIISAYMMATGKGSFLVAGYNTSSPAKRAQYKEQELTKAVGTLMFFFLLLLILAIESMVALQNMTLFWALIIISTAFILAGLIYINTNSRFRQDPSAITPVYDGDFKKKMIYVAIAVFIVLAVSIVLASTLLGSNIDATLHDDHLQVQGPLFEINVDYGSIDTVELVEDLDLGRRLFGVGDFTIKSGTFSNDAFGNYELAVHADVNKFIVIHHGGEVLVFNQQSVEDTVSFYNDLLNKLP